MLLCALLVLCETKITMCNRLVLVTTAAVLFVNLCVAQSEMPVQMNVQTTPQHSIMLIPYDPRFYISDADKDIIDETKKNAELIRNTFHNRTEWFVHRELKGRYPCVSLLQHDTVAEFIQAAGSLFNTTSFAYAKPMVPAYETLNKVLFNNNSADNSASDSRTATQYINEKNTNYMNSVVGKKEVFQKLFEKFGTDYFVFLTQFEIKTNYKNCLDIANQVYQRDVMLHFAVYDKNGKQIAGNFAVAHIPTSTNHMDDIISKCFPQLAEGIANSF